MAYNKKSSGKNRGNSKFEKSYKSYDRDDSRTVGFKSKDRATNDIKWWTEKGNQLVLDSANISFFNRVGSRNSGLTGYQTAHSSFPGIYTLKVATVPGRASGPSSPLNLATQSLYMEVRKANSGARNYLAPDLMKYILAMDGAWNLYMFLVRAYGVAKLYNQTNQYYPKGLLYAMGFTTDTSNPKCILNNLADFRKMINVFATRMSAMPVPNDIYIFQRHMHMFSFIYEDHATSKSQIYQFTPSRYWVYDEVSDPARLVGKMMPTSMDIDSVSQLISETIDPIMASEDLAIMCGDIIKAYGDKVMKMSLIDSEYTVLPTVSYEMLEQIQNSKWLHIAFKPDLAASPVDYNIYITEDTTNNCLIFDPEFWFSGFGNSDASQSGDYNRPALYVAHHSNGLMLNAHVDNPTPEMIMEMTRLCAGSVEHTGYESSTPMVEVGKYSSFGTEIVENQSITYTSATSDGFSDDPIIQMVCTRSGNANDVLGMTDEFSLLRHFDWHPGVWNLVSTANGTSVARVYELIETDNYAIVPFADIDKINEAAMLSVWRIPSAK